MFAGAQGTMLPWASLHKIVALERPYRDGEEALEATAAVQISCHYQRQHSYSEFMEIRWLPHTTFGAVM